MALLPERTWAIFIISSLVIGFTMSAYELSTNENTIYTDQNTALDKLLNGTQTEQAMDSNAGGVMQTAASVGNSITLTTFIWSSIWKAANPFSIIGTETYYGVLQVVAYMVTILRVMMSGVALWLLTKLIFRYAG